MLGPRKIDERGSHKVGTTPVIKRRAGPRIHRDFLRCLKGIGGESRCCSVLVNEASSGLLEEAMLSKILVDSVSNDASSSGAYVTGDDSH